MCVYICTRFSLLKEQDESPPLAKNSLKIMLTHPPPPRLPYLGKFPLHQIFILSLRKVNTPFPPTTKLRFSSYNPIKRSFSAAVTPVPFLF